MADSKKTYVDYSSVISTAIADFNSIFDAIKGRTGDSTLKDDTTGIATSEYATLINKKLFSIEGVEDGGTEHSIATTIKPYFSGTYAGVTAAQLGSDGKVSLTVDIPNKGYYDTAVKLSGSIEATNASLTGQIAAGGTLKYIPVGDGVDAAYWQISPANGKVLGTVKVAEGHYDAEIDGMTSSLGGTVSATIDTNAGIGGSVVDALPEGAKDSDYVSVALNLAGSFSGKVTPTVAHNADFVPGYINAEPTLSIAEKGYDVKGTNTGSKETIYIPKGKIEDVAVGGTDMAFTDNNSIGTSIAPEVTDNYYTVSAGIAGGKITGKVSAGYVEAGASTELGNLSAISKDFYVKKGAVADAAVNVTLAATPSTGLAIDSADEDAYTITIDRTKGEADEAGTITEGYVKAKTYGINTTVASKTLKIAKGSIKYTNTLTKDIALAGDGAAFLSSAQPAEGKYYTINPTVSITSALDAVNSKTGYIEPSTSNVVANTFDGAANPLYLAKGAVVHSTKLDVTNPTGETNNIFLNSAPTGKYFTVTTGCTTAVTPGYVTANDVTAGTEAKKYIPVAKFKYVSTSDSSHFVEVTSAGYVTSGSFAIDEGEIDYAAVKGTLSDTGAVLSSTGTTSDYKISIVKAATTDAGYISGTSGEGSLELDGNYYIKKGAVSYQQVIDTITKGAITKDAEAGNYKFTVTATGTTDTPTITEGYVKSDDVTQKAPANKSVDFTINQATLGTEAVGEAKITNTVASMVTDTSSKYTVTPSLSGATFKATVKSAGYVDESVVSDASAIQFAENAIEVVHIKAGTTKSFTAETAFAPTITNNFKSTVAGDYTVTVAGNADFTGALEPGYYGATEASITAKRAVSGTASVAHGKVALGSGSAKFGEVTSDVTLVTPAADAVSNYYKISVPVASVSLTPTVTEGYVKTADVSGNVDAAASDAKVVYLNKYELSEDKGSASKVGTLTEGETTVYNPYPNGITDGVVLHVGGTYSEHDIKVGLHADAIGTNAEADLLKLQQRLAGTLARATA